MSTAIHWFRNDLRVHDNPALLRATQEHDTVIPIYVFDEKYGASDPLGFPRMGAMRERFLKESLLDLRASLHEVGLPLLYREGDTVQVIKALADDLLVKEIYCCAEVCSEELDEEIAIERQFVLKKEFSQFLIHPEDMPMSIDDIPRVFTKWRHKVEKHLKVRQQVASISAQQSAIDQEEGVIKLPQVEIDERSAFTLKGGATPGRARIHSYLWDTDCIARYKVTRNGMIGEEYSGKFSAHLALGCISPRDIYHEVKRYEQEREKNDSTYWMIFELLWRDFFKYVALKHGSAIFQLAGIQGQGAQMEFRQDERAFTMWTDGRLKAPFVDANMLELSHTGWMSNRGRQNVASYLCHDLKVDWRWGARWFESQLIDYDASSNWCNWMYLASVGNDPRSRKFNIKRQADMYDGNGAFRALWLPS